MITIIAYNPTFAAAYNLQEAFSLWEETRLITLDTHKLWPGTEDLLLTAETASECKKLIENSRFTVIADAAGLAKDMLQIIGGKLWLTWAKKQRWIPFWGDTAYWADSTFYNDLMTELKPKVTFAMMDLMRLAPKGTIPLCHPVEDLGEPTKPGWLTVMHSPRSIRKRALKGTEEIERVMDLICDKFPAIDYQTIMSEHYQKSIRLKQSAHIFIDQIPAPGLPAGLGRSGEEALGSGAIVLTALHGQRYINGNFALPPVIPVYDEPGLYEAMAELCQSDLEEITEKGKQSRDWAKQYLFFNGWLDYVGQYL
jgi:hypothetical protein